MTKVNFVPRDHKRSGTPRLPLTNLSIEGGGTPHLRMRPGLVESAEYGNGPIRLTVTHLGKRYTVSGTAVYEDGTQIGTVAIGGTVQAAQSESELVITSGWNPYLIYDGVLSQITDEDLPQVSGVVSLGGRFYYPQRDSSQFFFSSVGSAGTIDALAYLNAESDPDNIVRMEVLGDDIAIFGERTIEWHSETGDNDTPLRRSDGRKIDKGCPSPYSVVKADNTLFCVLTEGDQGPQVYRLSNVPQKISNATVDAELEACDSLSSITAVSIIVEGHSYYLLNITGRGSWAYDMATQSWARWTSYDRDVFRIRCGEGGVFGDDTTGQLFTFDPDIRTDDGDPIICEASTFVPVTSAGVCGVLSLIGANGVGLATGQGSDPIVEMRYSNGGLGDFTVWRNASMGVMGDRSRHPTWRQLGMMRAPGRTFQFRWSDPVLTVPYYLLVNEYP